jgi:hypothetical protein
MRRRYAYWLGPEELESVKRRHLEEKRRRLMPVKGVPCKGLHPSVEISYVAPGEWDKVCRRQGSWYRESARRGACLVVADEPNRLPGRRPTTIIESSDFAPPRLPDPEEAAELARSEAFVRRAPRGWYEVSDRDRAHWRRMLSMMAASGDLDDLIEQHAANHANFIAPRFFVREGADRRPTPYSIARTAGVCSACVELFDLLGADYPTGYVMPCPGLVLFARLAADRYVRVTRSRGTTCT